MGTSFQDVLAVAALVRDFPRPWFVAGGWAIDLFVDEVTRDHEDVEIGIFRHDQLLLRPLLRGHVVQRCVHSGDHVDLVPWEKGTMIERPDFQVKVNFQTGGWPAFDIFLNTLEDGHLLFRRNHAIRRPWRDLVLRASQGLPYLAPEWQLLYKAKRKEAKERQDLERALERMSDGQRAWLRQALGMAHPGHEWTDRLEESKSTP